MCVCVCVAKKRFSLVSQGWMFGKWIKFSMFSSRVCGLKRVVRASVGG